MQTIKLLSFIGMFSITVTAQAQISSNNAPNIATYIYAKEYNKEFSIYNAKTFVMESVLDVTVEPVRFEIYPLAAANSGELTTLVYKCEKQNKSGLILGFYGHRWNDAGISFEQYAFKNLPEKIANDFLDKIDSIEYANHKYTSSDGDNNNVYFNFDDMTILIYYTGLFPRLRVYWNGFDSQLDWSSFLKTERRMARKLK